MRETNSKTNSTWTDKHLAFSLKKDLSKAAMSLWQWIVLFLGEDSQVELDLEEFKKWLDKKAGSGYSRRTLVDAVEQLEKAGILRQKRKVTWSFYLVIIDSHPWYRRTKKVNSQTCQKSPSSEKAEKTKEQAIREMNARKELEQQQHKFRELLAKEKLEPRPNFLRAILRFTEEELRNALSLMKIRAMKNTINNPLGFLRQCLVQGWIYEPANDAMIFAYENSDLCINQFSII